jgi:hypothetical protein
MREEEAGWAEPDSARKKIVKPFFFFKSVL